MKIGYARVSTITQNMELQIDALKKFGCEKIIQEIAKGARQDRPELNNLLEKQQLG
jgi:DNA invertase Pin-like site-specific DNA recombinase